MPCNKITNHAVDTVCKQVKLADEIPAKQKRNKIKFRRKRVNNNNQRAKCQ